MEPNREAAARPTPAPRGAHRLIERHKELDHAHLAMVGRKELPSAWRLVSSLQFVRTALRAWLFRPRPAVAAPVPAPAPGALAVTLVGHATVMLTTPTTRVLTDPCFARQLWGLYRATPAALDAGDLGAVDLVLISHAHRDHLHLPSLRRLPRSATVLAPAGCVDLISPLGFAGVVGLEPGATFGFRDVVVTAVPARHDGRRGLFDPRWRGALGYFIKSPDVGAYFAGDTAFYSGFRELGRRHRPNVALLPISGYLPLSERETHMSPLDAIAAFDELGADLLIPIAHGAFPLGYEKPGAAVDWLTALAAERGVTERVRVLPSGATCLVRRAP
jgi:L-ascorbate metabolism protein UlaG (beta-lactamase superfamily)